MNYEYYSVPDLKTFPNECVWCSFLPVSCPYTKNKGDCPRMKKPKTIVAQAQLDKGE